MNMSKRNRPSLAPTEKSGNTSDRLALIKEKNLDEALVELLAEGKIIATADENGEMLYKIAPSGSKNPAQVPLA
jgi:hypothetical protein